MSDYEELRRRLEEAIPDPNWFGEFQALNHRWPDDRECAIEAVWSLILETLKAKDEEHDGKLSDVPDLMMATMPMAFLECPHCGGELFTLAQLKVYVGDGSDLPDDAPSQPSSTESGTSSEGPSGTPHGEEEPSRLPSPNQTPTNA